MIDRSPENVIEWLTGDARVGMTLSQTKWINRVRKLKKTHPEDVGLVENDDGSVFASIPIGWLKVSAPRTLSDERKAELAARMKLIAESKAK